MAKMLSPVDPGYCALVCEVNPDGTRRHLIIFDSEDWRLELGSWAAKPCAVKFDPALCGMNPEELGFAPGWVAVKP
jgi:hypothetical protein